MKKSRSRRKALAGRLYTTSRGGEFTKEDENFLPKLFSALKENDSLVTSLDLTECGIMDSNMLRLASVLRSNKTLTSLTLANNKITYVSMDDFGKCLVHNEKIAHIDLAENGLSTKGGLKLAAALGQRQIGYVLSRWFDTGKPHQGTSPHEPPTL